MKNLSLNNLEFWDQLLEMVFTPETRPTDEQVDEELRQAGIDISPSVSRVRAMIEQHKARARLKSAKATRSSMLERLQGVVAPVAENLRSTIHDFIARTFHGQEQTAHFHKLEKLASEDDLKSLMDDLMKLANLRESNGNAETKGQ